jgi:hypothetical protein
VILWYHVIINQQEKLKVKKIAIIVLFLISSMAYANMTGNNGCAVVLGDRVYYQDFC